MDDREFNMRLGQQLQKYRRQRMLTLEEVVEMTDISDKHLGRIERGEKDTTATILFKLADGRPIKNYIYMVA